jgi:hypothetical protein
MGSDRPPDRPARGSSRGSGAGLDDQQVVTQIQHSVPGHPAVNQGGRGTVPGTIEQHCGPDEWQVCIEAREVAVLEDGTIPPPDTPDEDLFYPMCYRDRSEIRQSPLPGQ